jgi:probable rRNA maturation factor
VHEEVFVANEQDDEPVDCERWAALAHAVLVAEGVGERAELSVLFVDETTIAAMNERYLGHAGPTDVLSFPIEDTPTVRGPGPGGVRRDGPGGEGPGDGWRGSDEEEPLLLGDVVICPSVAQRNAPEHAGTYDDELALLLVHGILHLLGMDHEDDDEANAMEAREQALLRAHHGEAATKAPE